MKILNHRIDWLSIGTYVLPQAFSNIEIQKDSKYVLPGSKSYYFKNIFFEKIGIVIYFDSVFDDVPFFQIQFQGKYWCDFNHPKRNRSKLPLTKQMFREMGLSARIQRLDYMVDYLGRWRSTLTKRGKIARFWDDGEYYTGWLKRSKIYVRRNYDKTINSNGKINIQYCLSVDSQVKRMEVQVCSQKFGRMKIGMNLRGAIGHAKWEIQKYFTEKNKRGEKHLNLFGKKIKQKPPETKNLLKSREYFLAIARKALEKVSLVDERNTSENQDCLNDKYANLLELAKQRRIQNVQLLQAEIRGSKPTTDEEYTLIFGDKY